MLTNTEAEIYSQTVVLERLSSKADSFGAEREQEWAELSRPPCRLWWWKGSKSTDKSASAQYARPQTTLNETGGDMILPLGIDVTDLDRVARVLDEDGDVITVGPFRVLSVNPYEDHIELSLERP